MKILMILPNLLNVQTGGKKKIPTLFASSGTGLKILAALTPPEHEIVIVNEVLGERFDEDGTFGLVAVSMITAQATRGYEIGDFFKARGVPVVMGGIHPSTLPEEALLHANAVCIGEGERTWPEVIRDAEAGSLRRIYRADKLIDMREVPRLDLDRFRTDRMQNFIQTTRGCPFHCKFCTVKKFYGNTFRTSPVEEIVEEIRLKKKRGLLRFNLVVFTDDNIIGDETYARALFAAIKHLKIRWISQVSINVGEKPELLDLARASGCIGFLIGLDSVMTESLENADKFFAERVDYAAAIREIYRRHIFIYGMFIAGFDTDTVEVFDRTLEFIEENHLTYGVINALTPFPGTAYFEQFKAEGRLLDRDWNEYDLMHVVYRPKNMTPEELTFHRNRVTKRINSLPSIFRRVLGSRSQILFGLFFNLSLRKLFRFIPEL